MTSMRHALALGLVAALGLTACGGGTSPAPTVAPGESSTPAAPTGSPSGFTLPEPEVESLTIGLFGNETSALAGVLAVELGILEKYGISGEYVVFEGDARVTSALQAGQIQVAMLAPSNALLSQATDVPFGMQGLTSLILTDDLVCQAGIETADDVRGKTIAVSSLGGVSHGAALLALEALGLEPDDALMSAIGGQSARIPALQAGSVDCAIVDSNLRDEMTEQGLSIAVGLKEEAIQFGRTTVSMTDEFIEANPNTALVVVASMLEAQNAVWADTETVVPIYSELTELPEDEARVQVEDFLTVGNRSLMWTDDAITNPRDVIAFVEPNIADVDASEVSDPSFLQTLAENGFYDEIECPLPCE